MITNYLQPQVQYLVSHIIYIPMCSNYYYKLLTAPREVPINTNYLQPQVHYLLLQIVYIPM